MNNYYAHYFKNVHVFAQKLYYYAYDSNIAVSVNSSEDTNAHAELIPRG